MKALFRVDAGGRAGFGHFLRCLALAQAWRESGGTCLFACHSCPEALVQRLAAEEIPLVPLSAREKVPSSENFTWLVADGYEFSGNYLEALRRSFPRMLVIHDETEAPTGFPDLLLNPNLHANPASYRHLTNARCLLGSRYALLRREFREASSARPAPPAPAIRRIAVTFGGSDPRRATLPVARRLAQAGYEVTAVIGDIHPEKETLQGALAGLSARVLVNPPDLADIFQRQDLVVSAAGGTVWELAALGIPAIVVAVAPNQEKVARSLERNGAAISLGAWTDETPALCCEAAGALESPQKRETLRQSLRGLVDGRGAGRVERAMRFFDWTMLPAKPSDISEIWELSNHPEIRAQSLSVDPIPWEMHVAWFERTLKEALFLVLRDPAGRFAGQARIERKNGTENVISVSLVPSLRGRGIGSYLIDGISERFQDGSSEPVAAYVRAKNLPSRLAFQKCGYHEEETRGEVLRLVLPIRPS